MDNKLSELSKPVAWKFKNADGGDRVSLERKANIYGRHNFQPLYSQEYVSALLAELEATESRLHEVATVCVTAEQRIAELEAIRAAAEKLARCKGRYHSEQNYRTLAALFGVTTPDLPPVEGDSEAVIAELRAKLAVPVRLPEKYNMKMAGDKSTKSMFYGHNSAINDSAKAIRAADFTVEGYE